MRIPVRLRAGSAWADVCLLDVSSRGLLIQSPAALPRGAYVEVRRGRHIIVARVVWAKKNRFGVHTQERISFDALAGDRASPEAADPEEAATRQADRRSAARAVSLGERHQHSRMLGRSMEFGVLLVAGTSLAVLCASLANVALLDPLSHVTAALN